MNDFLKAMGQFGMEGLGIEPAEVSLEQEMNEEIAMEAELDEAYAQMDFANIVASTSQCEAILTAMAEREIGLESNAGRDAATIYGEFGLEAIKDVAMRKAYSGLASIKALINTCINWLKQLVGISVASKKIFSGLAKKAKAMKKQLGKVQSKVSEKLKRDMPDYTAVLKKLIDTQKKKGVYNSVSEHSGKDNSQFIEKLSKATKNELDGWIDNIKKSNEGFESKLDSLKEIYDKSDTSEYEGSACYSHIISFVGTLETLANSYKSVDMAKGYDKQIKAFEKLRNELGKTNTTITAPSTELSKYLNLKITNLTKYSNYGKKILKETVKVADDGLTMAKGIYAALV